MKIKYCYLRVLYVDYNNTIVGYSLVFSSADFSEIYEEIVPSDKIFDVLSSGYTYDFNIVSGVLMCEDVPRITASETDYNLFSIKRRINFDDDTIYSFILEGMLNDYLIVDDSILEVDEYTGGAVAKFDRIQIAKSTMSMYVNMYDSSDIYHQTLAYLHDGIIELKPFYVAVPVALKYQYNGLKSDAYHKDKNDDLVSFVYLYKDGILIDKEEDFDSFDQTIKLPSCGTSASDGITKLHVGYASKTAIFRDSVDYYNLIVGDWYSTTLTLHLNKDGKDAGPLKDANGNLITATVKFQAKTTDGSVKVEVKYDASLLAGETITAFETIRTKGYEVCGHTEITDEGQQIHYPELKTSAKNSKDNSQHVKEGEVAKIVDTVNYSKLDSSVAYKVVTEAWDYNTQQIVVSDGKKVRKVTELHVDSKKSENGSFDVSMSFKTDGLGKHRIVIFEYVYDNKGNLISKEADFDAESQTIYIDKTPNKTGDRTVVFLSILAGMLGLGVVTLFVTRRKKK